MPSAATAELLAEVGEAIPHIVFVARERTGALEHLSERFAELTGARVGEGLGLGYRAFVHPDDVAAIERAMRLAIRSRGALRSEARVRDRGGVFRWHEVRATRMRGRGARRWFGTCTDVDDTHRAAAAQLALADVALALTAARLPDEVLTTFASSVVEVLADVCAIDLWDATSRPRRAAISMATELGPVPPALAQADHDTTLSALAPSATYVGPPPPGLLAPLALTSAAIAPIAVAGGCVGHVVLATTTRTAAWSERDRAMLDDLVRRLASAFTSTRLLESARHASQGRDELLAVVSHELRTPLSTILGWARLVRSDPENEQRRARGLEVIERSAVTQGRIIDDLLDVSRALSGKLRLDPQNVSLCALARDATSAMRVSASEKGLTLDVATEGLAQVRVDPERIRQVVWNLVANAVKFTPHGGHVTVSVGAEDGLARVIVTDDGIGLDPSFLPYVFDRFRQADSSWTRTQGGLGLGLALVRAIVEQHGGSVRAESEGLGKGCRMIVELPEGSVVASAPTALKTEARVPSTDLLGVRVLVVDDDPDARDLCALILGMHGARVSTAESAADAMARLDVEDVEVMVSDIGMPNEDGCSLVSRAKARHPGLRSIALSAYAQREDSERAIAAGFVEHLAKPVDPSHLIDTVRAIARAS